MRGTIRLARGDGPAAERSLRRAYTAALGSGDMPIVATVAVGVAGLAALRGRHRDTATLLGAAARLRGAHDRTDPQIRTLTARSRALLGDEPFTEAYEAGRQLDVPTALSRADPHDCAVSRRPDPPRTRLSPEPTDPPRHGLSAVRVRPRSSLTRRSPVEAPPTEVEPGERPQRVAVAGAGPDLAGVLAFRTAPDDRDQAGARRGTRSRRPEPGTGRAVRAAANSAPRPANAGACPRRPPCTGRSGPPRGG